MDQCGLGYMQIGNNVEGSIFVDDLGEVGFQALIKHMGDVDGENKYAKRAVWLKIGDISLIDHRFKDENLEKTLTEILLWKFSAFLNHPQNFIYSLLTIHALDHLALSNKKVLDLGSGEGTLSLIALKKGAQSVQAIDIDEKSIDLFKKNININGIDPLKVKLLNENIMNGKKILEGISRDVEVVFANLGPHFGEADLAAIELTSHLPKTRTVVIGGYFEDKGFYPYRALVHLANLGFKKNVKRFKDMSGRVSMIVER